MLLNIHQATKRSSVNMFRNFVLSTVLIITLLTFIHRAQGSKYSKEANKYGQDDSDLDFEKQENPFRMQKVNLLWAKAKKRLSGVKLADLYADLKIHDKHEAHLKKLRADSMDKDGAMEAKVLINYKRIVEHYDLDDGFANEIPDEDEEKKDVHFQDPKLQTMWKRAVQAGFSDEDLKVLQEEFWHQQMKINEYDFVHREMDKIADPNDNSVEWEQKKLGLSASDAKEKKAAMKKDLRNIKEGYMRLEHIASNLPSAEPKFKDSRVHKLWALATKTNWTEEELFSFKEELKHFEHRLNKQAYYQEQLELSADAVEGKEDEIYLEKHQQLEQKHEQISEKVKKIHADIKTRLDKALRHSEL